MGEIEQVARWDRGLAGRLRIGVIPTVAPYLLPSALPLLRARNLSLDLGVREAQTERLIEEVRERRARRGGGGAAGRGRPDLVAAPLFEDRFLLAGSPARLEALGAAGLALQPEDMEPGQLLLLDDGHCLADQTLAACAVDRARLRMDLRAASLTTLCRLVSEGFGLTLLPELAVRAECAAAPGLRLARFADARAEADDRAGAPGAVGGRRLVRRAGGDPRRGRAGGDRRRRAAAAQPCVLRADIPGAPRLCCRDTGGEDRA